MPLYDILNQFQMGSSHMAAVIKATGKNKETPQKIEETHEENKSIGGHSQFTPLLQKQGEKSASGVLDVDKPSRPSSTNKLTGLQHSDDSTANGPSSENIEYGEVIGIITLEDVFEELLQEEIVDETDEYVDVQRLSLLIASMDTNYFLYFFPPLFLTIKGGHTKPGQNPKKHAE